MADLWPLLLHPFMDRQTAARMVLFCFIIILKDSRWFSMVFRFFHHRTGCLEQPVPGAPPETGFSKPLKFGLHPKARNLMLLVNAGLGVISTQPAQRVNNYS